MDREDKDEAIVDLINVYHRAAEAAIQAKQLSRDSHLPMMERVAHRHKAHEYQALADQALRMVKELRGRMAA